ncbi:MAG: response regulator, partial [Acholeplasmatales bacterium]|nr:response regulator [Acholeplasmatales bacterium]
DTDSKSVVLKPLHDITDEIRVHQVESEIRRAHYFNQIFNILSDKTSDAYILFSLPDFEVEYVSENVERLLGFDMDKIYQDGMDVVRPEGMDPRDSRASILAIPDDQSMTYERIRTIKGTGEQRIFEDAFYVTEIEGQRKGLAIFSDVTEDKRARQTLAAALDNANNASKAKTDFLYNMSHDIRTPMNAIYGLIQLLSKDISKDSHAWTHLEKINVASESMLEIINNILDMSRIESGKVVLNEDAFNVEDVINEIEVVYTEQAKNKNLTLSKDLALTHKQYIGDYVRLKQIITNLLSNSIKYTKEGGMINLSVKTAVDNNVDYDVIRFIVSDTGIGMSEEFQKVIFTPFAREKSATQSGVSGTGLGMAIVKNLTELMGGHVTVQSELGKGTTITIEIPFKRVDTEIIVDKDIYGSDISSDITGVKVLVVEDNDLNAGIVMELLEDSGATCERATNGKEAYEAFISSEEGKYDVILMDVQMPIMNGYEASQAIRQSDHAQAKSIIIVAMTANAFIEDVRHAFDAGMNCHISKPIYIDELCKTLNLLLKR